jgi:type III restriction enzyme
MANPFFDHPILNSPYACPQRHWKLDGQGQPTQQVIEQRRRADFITPIPKPKKRKGKASAQQDLVFDEGLGLSTQEQQYDMTSINEVRSHVDRWQGLSNHSKWRVTPETARLLLHWRSRLWIKR